VKVAVLTLTRDRLDYTKHCFARLRKFAGISYSHYVLDQNSSDGTQKWLKRQYNEDHVECIALLRENIGINRGMNTLVKWAQQNDDYDVIVKIDNDCELIEPDTLRIVCELSDAGYALLSPRIAGLNNPPPATGEFEIEGETILDIPQIGGIFTAAPAWIYDQFSFDGTKLLDDDVQLCWWYRARGGRCGYVERLTANHFETTSGQHTRYPDYFARTLAEGKPAL